MRRKRKRPITVTFCFRQNFFRYFFRYFFRFLSIWGCQISFDFREISVFREVRHQIWHTHRRLFKILSYRNVRRAMLVTTVSSVGQVATCFFPKLIISAQANRNFRNSSKEIERNRKKSKEISRILRIWLHGAVDHGLSCAVTIGRVRRRSGRGGIGRAVLWHIWTISRGNPLNLTPELN